MHKQPKPPPLIRTDISPQEALAEFLDRCGYDGSEYVPQLFATHAHQLAEQQRRWADEANFVLPVKVDGRDVPTIARQVAGILAALIDPEAGV
jgi:hypothetical protein